MQNWSKAFAFLKVGVSVREKRKTFFLRDVQTDRKGYRKRAGGGKEEERERAIVRGM